MSQHYGAADRTTSLATISRALELGIFFLDTADSYGDGHNELLVGHALQGRRSQFVVATKFSLSRDRHGIRRVNGRPENVTACCESSLRRLGTEYIDLYYQHRVDPAVPIEETVGAMKSLVEQGKVLHLGLSEPSSRSLERASAVHPISAIQSEWSLWTRDVEGDVLATARRLDVGIVPFSPLGRGMLTGSIGPDSEFDDTDFRSRNPRFQGANLESNSGLVAAGSAKVCYARAACAGLASSAGKGCRAHPRNEAPPLP